MNHHWICARCGESLDESGSATECVPDRPSSPAESDKTKLIEALGGNLRPLNADDYSLRVNSPPVPQSAPVEPKVLLVGHGSNPLRERMREVMQLTDRPVEPKCERCDGWGTFLANDDAGITALVCGDCDGTGYLPPATTEPAESEGKADTLRTITPKRFDEFGREAGTGVGTKDIYPTAPAIDSAEDARTMKHEMKLSLAAQGMQVDNIYQCVKCKALLYEEFPERDCPAEQYAAKRLESERAEIERKAVDRFAQECKSVTTDLMIQEGILDKFIAEVNPRTELYRHLIDANDTDTWAEYRYRAGTNKGLRDAARIIERKMQTVKERIYGKQ